MGTGWLIRLIAVGAFAAAPVALETGPAEGIATGDATATGPGIGFENTGGNASFGEGHSESHVVIGDPKAAPPAAVPALGTLTTPAKTAASDAIARARAQVDAARARAQAQIDAARAQAEQAVAEARARAAEAQAQSQQQSDDARAQAASSSAAANAGD